MNNLTIRDAKIIFRNFAGKGSQFNPEGRRNFGVVIEDEGLISALRSDGWLVKPLKKRDEDESQKYHLPVTVSYAKIKPTIVLISGQNQKHLDESDINMLDWTRLIKVDLTINPSYYKNPTREGIKAYLKTMIAYMEEDELLSELQAMDSISNEEDLPF